MRTLRLVLVLLLLAVGSAAFAAARLSERSPVRMGLWWDPQHGGSGFELFRGSEEVAVIWYTYREDGTPVWYSAIGRFDDAGRWSAPLMQHRWAQGRHGGASQVGQLEFRRTHFESIALSWKLGTRAGTQALVPFPVSGIVPEVDHSGAWYDPARSGFGLSLVEQGEWLGGALYFYDGSGQPTWAVRNNDGSGTTLQLKMLTGRCPDCAATTPRTLDEGALALRFLGESNLDAEYWANGLAAWPLDGELVQVSQPASRRPADRQLAAFESAEQLRGHLVEALVAELDAPSYPIVDFSPAPAPAGVHFSATNLQEAGVDEADRVKTDGRWVYALRAGRSASEPTTVRIAEVSDGGAQLAVRNDFPLPPETAGLPYAGMYLTERSLLALASTQPYSHSGRFWASIRLWESGKTVAAFYDRMLPPPAAVRRLEFEAGLVASRRVGDRVYLVLRSVSRYPSFSGLAGDEQRYAAVRAMPLDALLPRVRVDGGDWQPLLRPQDVHLPVYGQRLVTAELLTVVTLDLAAPTRFEAFAIAGRVDAVYATPDALYVASSRHALATDGPVSRPVPFQVTDVHRIGLAAGGATPQATGSVEGYLDRDLDRAPFRFSEHRGKLRLVTVSDGMWGARGVNRLTVLEPSSVAPGVLKTVSYLPNRERPAPIGKPGEQLYATRFVGETLYAVTFVQIDPLYVVDLADPADPRLAGEVELPGVSEYLHPVGDDLLVGVGYDATSPIPGSTSTLFQGLQFSLFDVSEPARPRVIQQAVLGKRPSGSAAIRDHHAVSVLRTGETTRFTLPVRVHEATGNEPVPVPAGYLYPWSWSGLHALEVTSLDPATARLLSNPALVTHRISLETPGLSYDDALNHARSIQFGHGTVYVESGRFWLSRGDGVLISGPQ